MTDLDPNVVYEKLTELAVRQAEMHTQIENDSRANWKEHGEIRDRLDEGNGHMADVRRDLDNKIADDEHKDIATEAVTKVIKRGTGAVLVLVTVMSGAVPIAFLVASRIW